MLWFLAVILGSWRRDRGDPAANILVRLVETGLPREGPRIPVPQVFRIVGSIAWSRLRRGVQSLAVVRYAPITGVPYPRHPRPSPRGPGRTDVCPAVITRLRPYERDATTRIFMARHCTQHTAAGRARTPSDAPSPLRSCTMHQ